MVFGLGETFLIRQFVLFLLFQLLLGNRDLVIPVGGSVGSFVVFEWLRLWHVFTCRGSSTNERIRILT
jgi:hypothetical protein